MPSAYWRDDYEALSPASLAGVPFHVDTDELEAGRRKAVQKFPGTDFVRGQDLGPGEDEYTVNGYIIGEGYHLVRDRLIAAFKDPADKIFVHPSYGRLTVTIEGRLKLTQAVRKAGGRASFVFKCIVVPPTTSSSSTTPNLANLSALGANVLRSTATPALASQLTQLTKAAPNAALVSNVSKLQTALKSAYTATQGAITVASDIAGQIDALASGVASSLESPLAIMEQIGSVVSTVMGAPMKVANAGRNVVNTLSDGQRVAAMLGIAEFFRSPEGPALPPLTERVISSAPSEDASQVDAAVHVGAAITAMVRVSLVATMVESLATRLPESSAQAREAQDEILAAIAGIGGGDPDALLFAVSDEIREQLTNVRTAAMSYLTAAAASLPELRTHTTPAETDALMLAFELLGDASRWEELVTRNGILNPALIPAGTVVEYIEVL